VAKRPRKTPDEQVGPELTTIRLVLVIAVVIRLLVGC
jgi:hypothetical protein